jgi:hypothetical protein
MRIHQARTVLQHAPGLVDLVIQAQMGLDAASPWPLTGRLRSAAIVLIHSKA